MFIILCPCLLQLFTVKVHADELTLRVAFNSNLVPYNFIDEDGKYRGMHIDIMNWIAERKNLQIVYVPYETDGECLNALNNSAVDVILGHKTNDTEAASLNTQMSCLFPHYV
jgi:ABC-type amino acid transport substrate-binding protein